MSDQIAYGGELDLEMFRVHFVQHHLVCLDWQECASPHMKGYFIRKVTWGVKWSPAVGAATDPSNFE